MISRIPTSRAFTEKGFQQVKFINHLMNNCVNMLQKGLSLCHKLKFSNPSTFLHTDYVNL